MDVDEIMSIMEDLSSRERGTLLCQVRVMGAELLRRHIVVTGQVVTPGLDKPFNDSPRLSPPDRFNPL